MVWWVPYYGGRDCPLISVAMVHLCVLRTQSSWQSRIIVANDAICICQLIVNRTSWMSFTRKWQLDDCLTHMQQSSSIYINSGTEVTFDIGIMFQCWWWYGHGRHHLNRTKSLETILNSPFSSNWKCVAHDLRQNTIRPSHKIWMITLDSYLTFNVTRSTAAFYVTCSCESLSKLRFVAVWWTLLAKATI